MMEDTATKLKNWAAEMGVPAQNLPSDTALRNLCSGQCQDIWGYIVHHIKTKEKVKNIKGNLECRRLECTEVKLSGKEQEKRRKLIEQLLSLRADVEQLDESADREQQDIEEQALKETRERLQDLKQRNTLLKAFLQRTVSQRKNLQEQSKKVGDRLHAFTQISSKAEQEIELGNAQDGTLWSGRGQEPEVLRDVRRTCFTRFHFLKSLYDEQANATGGMGDGGHDLRSTNYHQWLSQVEGVNATHPPNHILAALESLAAENKEELMELQSKVDVAKDMEALRFSYSCSRLQDVSEPLPVLRSVKSLLDERWRDCEVRAVEKIGAIRRDKEASSRLTSLSREFNLLLEEQYGHSTELLATVREALELELSTTERRAYCQELSEQAHLLTKSICAKKCEIQILQHKHSRIVDFQALVDTKQDLIRALVKGNSSAKSQLMKTQVEIGSFVEQKLGKHEDGIRSLTEDLHNSVSREVNLFTGISLPNLDRRVVQELQRVPVHKLSIHRLDSSFNKPHFFREVKKTLYFPLYKASEFLVERAAEMKMEALFVRVILQQQRDALQTLQRQYSITPVTDADALIERVQRLDEECSKTSVPSIRKISYKCDQAIHFTDELRNDVQDWWLQPAQFVLPWVKKHGLNVQEWIHKWHDLIHRGLMQTRGGAPSGKPCSS
ncbi:HAUS augmin-like complex subunit 5 [Cetorhinus maximus]